MSDLQERAVRLERAGHFVGGPSQYFEAVGRHQFITLLECGLLPDQSVLDVGCGCLRAGYWLIHFLGKGRYCGIEPNAEMLEMGKREFIGPELLAQKSPRFSTRDDFDFTGFGVAFDFVLARSVWTHASAVQIEKMLDSFCATAAPDAVFLTSYKRTTLRRRQYRGSEWVGRSHRSDTPGIVRYDFAWIRRICAARGLAVRELDNVVLNQVWLRIDRDPARAEAGSALETMPQPPRAVIWLHRKLTAARPLV